MYRTCMLKNKTFIGKKIKENLNDMEMHTMFMDWNI